MSIKSSTAKHIKQGLSAFSFLSRLLLKFLYLFISNKKLWYLRQWLHAPSHIAPPQYGIAYYQGVKLKVNLCEMTGGNLYYGLNLIDKPELDIMASLSKKDILIDVGANIGLYSLLAPCKSYAIEPATMNFKLLEKNIKLNDRNNIFCYKLALSDKKGDAWLYLNDQSGLTGFVYNNRGNLIGKELVPTDTLDNFIEEYQIRPTFIKVDVEGHELQVLKGGIKTIEKYYPKIMIELDPKNGDTQKATAFLLNVGYTQKPIMRSNGIPINYLFMHNLKNL